METNYIVSLPEESVAVAENIWYVDDVKFYRSMLALHRGASVTIAS